MQTQLNLLSKRKLRYWCFRFATEALEGVPATGAPKGVREHYESLKWFQGWKNFGKTWDVDHDRPLDVVPLGRSLEEEWDEEASKLAKDLPT